MNVNWRGALVYLLILIAAGALILGVFPMGRTEEEIPISQVAQNVNDGEVKSIAVKENELEVTLEGEETIISRKEEGVDLPEIPEGAGRLDSMLDTPTLQEFQRRAEEAYLLHHLNRHAWNVAATARAIDTPRSNLYKKMQAYDIKREGS